MRRELHLNLSIHSRGHHEAAWRHPASSELAPTDIEYYQSLAQRAEAALFDSIFFADQLALGGDVAQAPRTWLEPITVLAAIATVTKRVGLIATASTTYTEPFNLARQFASVDHISKGRAAWNIVTSWLATAAENYGGSGQVSHADRYSRGEEFMEVVKDLWDSWAADAVVDDRTAFERSSTAAISTPSRDPSTSRAALRAGRCWCRRDRPTPAAASRHGMPTRCSPPIWRNPRRRNSMPI
jgi:alkanesulfonate monooxygenase SsuD/methylene tetrahydromethanopterin reductase-like flavin-dependent oxidoreductase (luciferase family)